MPDQDEDFKYALSVGRTKWDFLAELTRYCLYRGQIVPLAVFVLLFVLFVKLDAEAAKTLLKDILGLLRRYEFYGWVVSAGMFLSWIVHVNWTRRVYSREIARITMERNHLQQQKITPPPSSSKGKRGN